MSGGAPAQTGGGSPTGPSAANRAEMSTARARLNEDKAAGRERGGGGGGQSARLCGRTHFKQYSQRLYVQSLYVTGVCPVQKHRMPMLEHAPGCYDVIGNRAGRDESPQPPRSLASGSIAPGLLAGGRPTSRTHSGVRGALLFWANGAQKGDAQEP